MADNKQRLRLNDQYGLGLSGLGPPSLDSGPRPIPRRVQASTLPSMASNSALIRMLSRRARREAVWRRPARSRARASRFMRSSAWRM